MICPNCKKEVELIEETSSQVSTIKDKDGRVKTWTEETRDSDGILLSKRVDEYKYFVNGDIDIITLKSYDGDDLLLSSKEVEHKTQVEDVEHEYN